MRTYTMITDLAAGLPSEETAEERLERWARDCAGAAASSRGVTL